MKKLLLDVIKNMGMNSSSIKLEMGHDEAIAQLKEAGVELNASPIVEKCYYFHMDDKEYSLSGNRLRLVVQ